MKPIGREITERCRYSATAKCHSRDRIGCKANRHTERSRKLVLPFFLESGRAMTQRKEGTWLAHDTSTEKSWLSTEKRMTVTWDAGRKTFGCRMALSRAESGRGSSASLDQ